MNVGVAVGGLSLTALGQQILSWPFLRIKPKLNIAEKTKLYLGVEEIPINSSKNMNDADINKIDQIRSVAAYRHHKVAHKWKK